MNKEYIAKIISSSNKIPKEARKLAITGMETSYSKYFKYILELSKKYKVDGRFVFIFLNSIGSS